MNCAMRPRGLSMPTGDTERRGKNGLDGRTLRFRICRRSNGVMPTTSNTNTRINARCARPNRMLTPGRRRSSWFGVRIVTEPLRFSSTRKTRMELFVRRPCVKPVDSRLLSRWPTRISSCLGWRTQMSCDSWARNSPHCRRTRRKSIKSHTRLTGLVICLCFILFLFWCTFVCEFYKMIIITK